MGDSPDSKPASVPESAGIPAWQQRSRPDDAPAAAPDTPPGKLDVSRRFLDDDQVRTVSRGKKAAFLRSKGIQDGDIERLLAETDAKAEPRATHAHVPGDAEGRGLAEAAPTQHDAAQASTPPTAAADRPPVVTYPEFLAKPPRPPPLVTTGGLLNTLYAFAGFSTLVYAMSKYAVAPMVDTLTEARSELHRTASDKLRALVSKLEKTVSEIPPSRAQQLAPADDAGDAEDPTEMFHRDVGTQTCLPSPAGPAAALPGDVAEPPSKRHAHRLSAAARTLSGLKDQLRAQSEDLNDIRGLLDVFRDDLDGMTHGGQAPFVGGYSMFSSVKRMEPDDEIRKVRDNIRRVKGVLLSTRNFPSSTR